MSYMQSKMHSPITVKSGMMGREDQSIISHKSSIYQNMEFERESNIQ